VRPFVTVPPLALGTPQRLAFHGKTFDADAKIVGGVAQ